MMGTARSRSGVIVLGALCLSACSEVRPPSFPTDENLQAMLRYLVEDGETVGVVLGVLEADGSTRVLSFGEAGSGLQPLGEQSSFEIGSVSKVFTVTLLAEMARRGEVSLEDDVAGLLPDQASVPEFGGRAITLLDLATHTSGLPREPENNITYLRWTADSLYSWLSEHELRRQPGAEYEYSNLGVGLLGHALSRAAGTSLAEAMSERVLAPLGMTSTGFGVDSAPSEWMVTGHAGDVETDDYSFTEATEGAGGLRSTARDMLTFLAASVGPAESELERAIRSTHSVQRPTDDEGIQVGLAWQIGTMAGQQLLRHTGGTDGFFAEVLLNPEHGTGVVLLTNSRGYQDGLAVDLMAGGFSMADPEIEVAPAVLSSYAGTYTSEGGAPFYVRVDADGYLTGQMPDRTRFRLHAASETEFFARRVPFTFAFQSSPDGVIDALELRVGGRGNRFARSATDTPQAAAVAGNLIPPMDPDEIEVYEGTYLLEGNGQALEFRVFGEADRLMAELAGEVTRRLVPQGEHEFSAGPSGAARLTFAVEGGEAVGVTLTQGGQTLVGPKRE